MPETDVQEDTIDSLKAIKDFLEAKKGKRTPSKADCSKFAELWGALVREKGLPQAMPYLCRGFSFAAAEPLYAFIREKGGSRELFRAYWSYS